MEYEPRRTVKQDGGAFFDFPNFILFWNIVKGTITDEMRRKYEPERWKQEQNRIKNNQKG